MEWEKWFRNLVWFVLIGTFALVILNEAGKANAWISETYKTRRIECIEQTQNPMYCWEKY